MYKSFWYFTVLSFLVYNIVLLISEEQDVTFQLESFDKSYKSIKFLSCLNLDYIFNENEPEVDLSSLNVSVIKFLSKESSFNESDRLEQAKEQISLRKFVLFKNKFCLIFNSQFDPNYFALYLEGISYNYAINIETFEHSGFSYPLKVLEIVLIKNKEFSNLKCSHSSNKFICFNECIKKYQKLAHYYYKDDEKVNLRLKHNKSDKLILKNEKKCIRKCQKTESCTMTYYSAKLYGETTVKTFVAYPSITKLDFLIQLFGMTFLFINNSLFSLLYKFVKLMRQKISRLNGHPFILKIIIFLCNLILLLSLYYHMIANHVEKIDEPVTKEISSLIEPRESLNLVFCLQFEEIDINNKSANYSMFDYEKETNYYFEKKNLIEFYLDFLNQKVKFKLFKPKVFFTSSLRCFQLELFSELSNFENALFYLKLNIISKESLAIFHLLSEDKVFHSESFRLDSRYTYTKMIIKRSGLRVKPRCIDYKKFYRYCSNRIDCLDYCMSRKALKQFKAACWDSFVNKDHFKHEEWIKLNYVHCKTSFFDQFKKECEKEFKDVDCIEYKFINSAQIRNLNDYKGHSLDFYYTAINMVEEEVSFSRLCFDLLNLELILFALNLHKIIRQIFYRLNISLKAQSFAIHFICLIGLTYHLIHLFDKIINNDLVSSQYYEILDRVSMQESFFCLEFHRNLINENYKLNYNYLDKITKDINEEMIFDKIEYLNKNNEWISLDHRSNYSNKDLKIDKQYFLNKKCFRLKLNIVYERTELNDENQKNKVLKITFDKTYIYTINRPVYFLTKIPKSMYFSKLTKLIFKDDLNQTFVSKISQSVLEVNQFDKFNLIKNPFQLLLNVADNLNDLNRYLYKLESKLKREYKLRTLKLPVGKSDLEIDEDIFDQYLMETQNANNHQLFSSNFKKSFIINNLDQSPVFDCSAPDFHLSLTFFKPITLTTNEDNFVKIILIIMNALSFWLSFNILDLYIYIHKAKIVFSWTFKFILQLEIFLKKAAFAETETRSFLN